MFLAFPYQKMRDQIIQNRQSAQNYIFMNFTHCSFPSDPKIRRSSKISIPNSQSTHKRNPSTPSKSKSHSKTRLPWYLNEQKQYTLLSTSPDNKINNFLKDDNLSIILCQSSNTLQIDYQSLKPTHSISNHLDLHDFSSRQLLPRFLTEKLQPELQAIQKISDKLDQYLGNLESKKKMENFDSLKQYFCDNYDITIELKHLQFINNLIPHFYELYHDPLKNIIVGAQPQKLKSQLRKRNLRRNVIKFQELNQPLSEILGLSRFEGKFAWIIQTDEGQEKLLKEFKPINYLKVSKFFPKKQIKTSPRKKLPDKQIEKKPQQNFIHQIQDFVLHKNQEYQSIYKRVGSMVPETTKLLRVLQLFRKFYINKNINNIFKATLINLLIRQHLMPEQQAVGAVQQIIKVPNSCLKVIHVHKSAPIINFYQCLYKKTIHKLKSLPKQIQNAPTKSMSQISHQS